MWPIYRVGRMWKSFYNTLRGIKTYIEDRADLTLWEIRKFYEIWESLGGDEYCTNTCLSIKKKMHSIGGILLSGPDYELICRWLMHFGTFEMFVEFFCFRDSFLKNDEIINLINGKSLSEEYVNKKMKREEKRINDIDSKEELEEILLRIQNQIEKRTNNMLEKMTTMGDALWADYLTAYCPELLDKLTAPIYGVLLGKIEVEAAIQYIKDNILLF